MVYFRVTMQHTEKTLESLAHMQYDLFCRGNRVMRSALSLVLMVAGILNFSQWWGILIVAYGCYLTTSTYASANHTAHKLARQIRESGMAFPASRYLFCEDAMEIVSLPEENSDGEPLAYAGVARLGEDTNAFYIFRDQYGGYMIPKQELGDHAEEFRQFVQEKTGQSFHAQLAPVVRLMRRLRGRRRTAHGS